MMGYQLPNMLTIIVIILIVICLSGFLIAPTRPYFGATGGPVNLLTILLVVILIILLLQYTRVL